MATNGRPVDDFLTGIRKPESNVNGANVTQLPAPVRAIPHSARPRRRPDDDTDEPWLKRFYELEAAFRDKLNGRPPR